MSHFGSTERCRGALSPGNALLGRQSPLTSVKKSLEARGRGLPRFKHLGMFKLGVSALFLLSVVTSHLSAAPRGHQPSCLTHLGTRPRCWTGQQPGHPFWPTWHCGAEQGDVQHPTWWPLQPWGHCQSPPCHPRACPACSPRLGLLLGASPQPPDQTCPLSRIEPRHCCIPQVPAWVFLALQPIKRFLLLLSHLELLSAVMPLFSPWVFLDFLQRIWPDGLRQEFLTLRSFFPVLRPLSNFLLPSHRPAGKKSTIFCFPFPP